MYSGHAHLCVCLSVSVCRVCLSLAAFPPGCTDPDVILGNGRKCPIVVHYWADLQSVHGFRCYDNIARTRNVSECSVLALCLVYYSARNARNARIASAVLATAIPSVCPSVCLSVCPSVRPSHAGIVSKRRHVARCSLHRWIAKCV